jgi:hypothetical protein
MYVDISWAISKCIRSPDTKCLVKLFFGCTIAQAVSCWLPTVAGRVRSRVWSSGICGGQSSAGAGFLQVLQFPLPILIPSAALNSSSIIRVWYNRLVSSRRSKWTQSHPTPRNLKIKEIKQRRTLIWWDLIKKNVPFLSKLGFNKAKNGFRDSGKICWPLESCVWIGYKYRVHIT